MQTGKTRVLQMLNFSNPDCFFFYFQEHFSGHSDDFFEVFTVSSTEFEEENYLQQDETGRSILIVNMWQSKDAFLT